MSFKDFLDEGDQQPRRRRSPQLNSGTEALIDEAEEQFGEEDGSDGENIPSENNDINGLQTMAAGSPQMLDVKTIDRFIRIRGIPKVKPGDKHMFQWSDPGFMENLVVNSLTKKEIEHFKRRFHDLIDQSEGDGNEDMVRNRAACMGMELLLHRSAVDNPDCQNERAMWNTNNSTVKTINRTNVTPAKSGGIFSRLFGR